MSVNKAIIVGNLGADPEVRHTESGTAVANLSIATNERWKDKSGNKKERTEWHRVVVFGNQAENCAKYLEKGRQVYVEGRIQTNEWTDNDGQQRYTTEIVAQSVQFLSGGSGGGGGNRGGGGGQQYNNNAPAQHAHRNQAPMPQQNQGNFGGQQQQQQQQPQQGNFGGQQQQPQQNQPQQQGNFGGQQQQQQQQQPGFKNGFDDDEIPF